MKFGGTIKTGLTLGVGIFFLSACTPSSAQDTTVRDEEGVVVAEGEVGAFRIQVGDCLRGIDVGLVESADAVSCDSSHQYEVYHSYLFPDGDYPGDTVIGTTADEECLDAFEPFVGMDYATSVYGYTALQPVRESWDAVDDREVLCLIGKYDGTEKTGTARATAI